MGLSDDLKDYIGKNSEGKTAIPDLHSVVMVGEMHAPTEDTTGKSAIRTNSSTRLVEELLADAKYRYYASEYLSNAGPTRRSVRQFLRTGELPPAYDPDRDAKLDDVERMRRINVNRQSDILDKVRKDPRYVLSIGTDAKGSARDARMALHFFEEIKDRKLTHIIPGVLLVGRAHAGKTPYDTWPTLRMILEKHGFQCVSICKMTDYAGSGTLPEDGVVSTDTSLDEIKPADIIRLTSLVSNTPVTIPTDEKWGAEDSPFRKVTLGRTKSSVAEQFEFIVIEKAA